MNPAIPENKRVEPVQTAPAASESYHGEKLICPCCNQPYLRRMVVMECPGCGYRKIESETDVKS